MEEDINSLEKLIKRCEQCNLNECINCEISWSDVQAINELLKAYKEDEAVIEEMGTEIFIEHNPHFKTDKEVIEYFKNKVKENKE